MTFVCKVISIKTLLKKHVAVVSASVYDIKPTKNSTNLPVEVIHKGHSGDNIVCDITGYTCMEDDFLYHDYSGVHTVGDYLFFSNVGAYSFVLNPPFIKLSPPIIMLEKNGNSV